MYAMYVMHVIQHLAPIFTKQTGMHEYRHDMHACMGVGPSKGMDQSIHESTTGIYACMQGYACHRMHPHSSPSYGMVACLSCLRASDAWDQDG